jgi:hypothetical protein
MPLPPEPLALAQAYWERLRGRFPGVVGLYLRNPLADFVPGISDLDLRLIAKPSPGGGWEALAEAVLQVHLELAEPALWRLLEHPPGACVTPGEALDGRLFHPEMRQWQPVLGTPAVLSALDNHIGEVPWSPVEDRYWRARLGSCTQPWGPLEDRINLPPRQEARYLLHGVVMLRTLPALQAAYCVRCRRPVAGKLAALNAWHELRPQDPVLAELRGLIESDLDVRPYSSQEAVEALQGRCRRLVDELASTALVSTPPAGPEPGADQALLDLHNAVRFSRLRPAHYRWFALAPAGFQNGFFLVNEVITLRRSIVEPAALALAALAGGPTEAVTDAGAVLLGACRTDTERHAVGEVVRVALSDPGALEARRLLLDVLEWYSRFHEVLERALASALEGYTVGRGA